MKLKGTTPPNLGDMRLKGHYLTAMTPWGPVVRSWPKKRGGPKTPYDYYRQVEFGLVARMTKTPLPIAYAGAVASVDSTTMVPRDWMTRLAMGVGFTFVQPDGTIVEGARVTNPNFNYILDGITDTPGSMIYRADIGWVPVTPGNPGQFLALDTNGMPAWIDAGDDIAYTSGTWTPGISAETTPPTGATYSIQNGNYVHLTGPKLCFISALVTLTNKGTGGVGNAILNGLPKSPATTGPTRLPITTTILGPTYGTGRTGINAAIFATPTVVRFDTFGTGLGGLYLLWSSITNTTLVALQGVYKTT
jgi:hypothetical protein